MKNPELWLRKGADRRLRGGHQWIYSNEIDSKRSNLSSFSAGDQVVVKAAGGEILATALMEPQSLICARVFAEGERHYDLELLCERLQQAQDLRRSLFTEDYYRMVYGDSDRLSGIVVDRFADYLVLQLNTAGVERYQALLVEALVAVCQPRGILLRADSRSRRELGLEQRTEVVYGEVPEQVPLIENGVEFMAPIMTGQKTGWFYDHRDNRATLRRYVQESESRVLDTYSYVGGWGVQAAAFGAAEVVCVDSSAAALEAVAENARCNGVSDRVSVLQGQATVVMEQLIAAGERFDIVILDPPAFVQRRRDLGKGRKAYRRINELAMQLLQPGGLLVSASCSMQLELSDLLLELQSAARRTGHFVQVLETGHQGRDHPQHPAIPETAYLKAVFARVNPVS
ncbi:class I SAM-dependent rRNA methyltransferase [Halieaceae bacterium IMCC14734]|uniref:Class I SAM-dependent rRNA methyltransferase n=1 Tax=Candidatus Litorirhabdus singularis TaxID=2518993 RepID=A0ABT3TCQ0_9GAMM|nr:class I SAM-dependent rRNA methyltransferase [Candidatus Litorirhabdus singularis]MCX2980078.1 class I SAM-dependent rRNA methyltransferase [Candidatus Litorirhabdus singularis]